ncbi:MAG: pilus assembly protein PilM [Lachnospiraceae bacterium]|nr:pilus assembly protein PilM [Lachnospiraceae bacterium]
MASRTLTIEVGNEFVKVCEMQRAKGSVVVHHAISVQTPPDTVEDGYIKDIGQVAETIRRAMTEDQIVANEVTFVLNSSRVATKEVVLPLAKRDKIQEMVNMNASEYFPVNIDDYVLSYTILEEKKTKEEQKTRILVFAVPELMVQSYFDLAGVLGMKVKAVDYAGNSTLQLIKIQIDAKPTLVVQLGIDTTIVSVMTNNILQLQRTIPYGESLLLNKVMESRNLKAKAALELLASAQIVKDSLDRDETTSSLKYLISNVNRVIEYYSSRNQGAPLQKIVIIGEGADVLGMDVLFANETGLPTERLTLLKNVESYNRIKISTSLLKQYMANVGASLDPIHLQPKANVTGKQAKAEGGGGSLIPYIAVCGVLVVAAIALAVVPLAKYNSKKTEKSNLNKEIARLEPIEKEYEEYYHSLDQLKDLQEFHLTTISDTEWVVEFIDFLEEYMPSAWQFSSLSILEGKVAVNGVCVYEYELSGFMKDLEEQEHITDVVTSGYTKVYDENGDETQNVVTFDLTFNILADENVVDLDDDMTGTETNGEEAQ